MTDNLLLTILIISLGLSTVSIAQTVVPAPISDAVLDQQHPENAKTAIEKAATGGDFSALFKAMHNPRLDVQLYCLESVGKLGKVQQAQFLSQILSDNSLLVRKDKLFTGGGALINIQNQLQRRLEEMSYPLLGEIVPPEHGFLTEGEATALATKLSTVK